MKQKIKSVFSDFYSTISGDIFCRTLSAIFLFDFFERIRKNGFPYNWSDLLENELSKLIACFDFLNQSLETSYNDLDSWKTQELMDGIQEKTGEVYYQLWKDFKKEEYYLQAYNLLMERFDKNNISVDGVKFALDDGCGGGRYTLALKEIGCSTVYGIDASKNSVSFAKKMTPFSKKEVNFFTSSVLELPFENDLFDFVFSNGVLHHTINTQKGLEEIYRVLKTGGSCWLYLYGGKDSFFWDTVDFCRKLLADVPQQYTHL